ncbi:hypothetical protein FQN53_002236 [Emmonsiellopsis sp. PD_33]|nr:hypothetical protein FQN53_002236 [Emmonsiellopsis sp. PD_33]
MPVPSSSTRASTPPVPSPSNPVIAATQSQWIFTDSELYRTPSILDGMTIEAEHTSRSKGVNFITQVGILLKLPQLTLCTASVYLHRFFMRYSMKDLPQRPGMHPYSIAATALFLATKVEENCRKMKELIVACCRVAQKKPSMIVDEQSKEFWKWRDTILHNEDLLLEALCFDLQLEQPYRLLYDFSCFLKVQDNKRLRNSAWAFLNDSTYTVLCLQFPARTIAAAALYGAARHCEFTFEDDSLDRPWWEQLDVNLSEMRRACNRMADIYEFVSTPVPVQPYLHVSSQEDESNDKTRSAHQLKSEGSIDNLNNTPSPGEINGRKREREIHSGSLNQFPISLPPNGAASDNQDQPSPKRQRREDSDNDTRAESTSSFTQPHSNISSQTSFVQAASALDISSNPSSQTVASNPPSQLHSETNGHARTVSPARSRIPQSRIPLNAPRQEHPLPPPPPVAVPPLVPPPHPHQPRRGSYDNNSSTNSRVPRTGQPTTGSSVFHPPPPPHAPPPPPPPPPPPRSKPPNADELQQRIDAIIQQGLPAEPEQPHGQQQQQNHGRGSYPPSMDRDRDRHRDRDRDWDRDRNRDWDRGRDNRYRDRDWDRDRGRGRDRGRDRDRDRDRDRERDYDPPRRSSDAGSVAMSASLSASSLAAAPPIPPEPHPHAEQGPAIEAPAEQIVTGALTDEAPQAGMEKETDKDTGADKEKEANDGGGSEEGEV